VTAIAIVGMGCRFAGAPDLHSFWKMTLEGSNAFSAVPEDRWQEEAFLTSNRRNADGTYAPRGAFIDYVRSFPGLTLGIPPRRTEVMDPQQRFALECAIQAIHDGGYVPTTMPHKSGVFMGITAHEYRVLLSARVSAIQAATGQFGEPPAELGDLLRAYERLIPTRPYTAPGVLGNMSAAIVAQELDLHGPAYTTDAACSSAMVAIENAVEHLRSGKIDAALAGGAYLNLTPEHFVAFSRIGAMSRAGYCRPFDVRADGFVQGDGVGVLMLKRLDDALSDGDRIYATLEGVAINNDGRGDGPMAPHPDGQAEVISAAWADAGMDATDLGYIEAHGTGTAVGDIAELKGIRAAVGDQVSKVALGSSKANVGHTMSAAGVAGVIRAALSIYHKTIPPMGGFETPKPALELEGSKFWIPTEPTPWEGRRIAGVSSFGFGGTNGHAVLADYVPPSPEDTQLEVLLFSAADKAKLADLAGRTADAIEADPNLSVASVARAWALRRPLAARAGIIAGSRDELIERLRVVAAGKKGPGVYSGVAEDTPTLAFLFPGQGSQRPGMLRDLIKRFPQVEARLLELEAELSDALPLPLTHYLYPERRAMPVSDDVAMQELTETAVCQPVLLAVGVALHELLASLGVHPKVVTGHSLGEFTAAAAAGVLSAGSAANFVARRGQAMAALSGDRGAMIAVMNTPEVVKTYLVDGAVIANVNHPRQVVVSGLTDAVAQVKAMAEAAEERVVDLVVSHGFHSPALDGLDVSDLVNSLELHDPEITVASGIASQPYADADDARGVFTRHAVSPVIFTGALEQAVEEGANLFLQVGAGGPLASFARGTLQPGHKGVLTLASREDDDRGESLLKTLAELWVRGVNLDISAIVGAAPIGSVPPEVLPREVYWGIADRVIRPISMDGYTPREHKVAPQVIEAAPEPEVEEAASDLDETEAKVMAVIAKVSAYPLDSLHAGMGLTSDLGFDSIMVGDMATGLSDAFPGLGGIPQELLMNQPSIQDIIDFVKSGAVADTHDDDAPLNAWAPAWAPTPLPDLPTPSRSRTFQVRGPGAAPVAEALAAKGSRLDDSGALVWVDDLSREFDLFAQPIPDLAGELIAALGTKERDVLIVVRHDDPLAGALAGVARSLSREWSTRVKAIAVDGSADIADVLIAEHKSADRSADVAWLGGERHTLALQPVASDAATTPGEGDVVVISGGTRGIGLKLGKQLADNGAKVMLIGRKAPTGDALSTINAHERLTAVQADVLDPATLSGLHEVTHIVHAAGVLADGALDKVDPKAGALARAVKGQGLLNLIAASPNAKAATAIGSWAGRFGNRHQVHYGAANALMSSLAGAMSIPTSVGEYGPWVSSEMASTIPAPIQAAMRKEGVDFVGDDAGVNALIDDLGRSGALVRGRRVPSTTRTVEATLMLDPASMPFLNDHAIDGVPVMPLAGAADLIGWVAGIPEPFEIVDLTLYQGLAVREPLEITVRVSGDQAQIVQGERNALSYKAFVRPARAAEAPEALSGGNKPELALADFYADVTFHGPLLQGITELGGVADTFIHGQVRSGSPSAWMSTERLAWAVDPLALDSAFQLTAHVAYTRFKKAGTPVGFDRLVQLAPLPAGPVRAECHFDPEAIASSDRFQADVILRAADGSPLLIAYGVTADMKAVDPDEFVVDPKWVDPAQWDEVKDLKMRLQGVEMMGLRNPYFHVNEGTARDTTRIGGRDLVNYSSYNYIGLSGDPRVVEAAQQSVADFGTSVSASRVASGERPFHRELEELLAKAQGVDDALLFTAGHATNVNAIGHLFGPEDLVLHDELIHDSILQGIKLSGANRRGFRHEDPAHLESQLKQLRKHYKKVLIVVEGVYSMDGDICDLPAFIRLKKKYGCMLMVDEAHSFGVVGATGCGVGEFYEDVNPRDVDIWMGTLSKSLSSCGGWLSGSAALIEYMRYTAPGFVYSAGLTPANGVAALRSLQLMLEEPERVAKLQSNAEFFHGVCQENGLDNGPALGGSGVVPVVTGNSMHALVLSERLADAGINVQPIIYPAVADDAARLRFFLSSTHSFEQLKWTAETVASLLKDIREEYDL